MESTLFLINAFALVLIGLYGILSRSNLVKVLLALNILETGVNLIVVALGYFDGAEAPILTESAPSAGALLFADPLPHALVLTSIVIGLGTTALALTLTLRHYRRTGSLELSSGSPAKEASE